MMKREKRLLPDTENLIYERKCNECRQDRHPLTVSVTGIYYHGQQGVNKRRPELEVIE